MIWIQKRAVDMAEVQTRFTIIPRDFTDGKDPPAPVYQWKEWEGLIGLPIVAGLAFCHRHGIAVTYEPRDGFGVLQSLRLPDPNHPKAMAGQGDFVEDIIFGLQERGCILAQAQTGAGKTVSALSVAGQLGLATLVIVTSNTLADQWRQEAMLHLGLSEDEIAMCSAGNYPHEGKSFGICVVHNVIDRCDMSEEFINHWGTVIWDEAHRCPAREFSKSLTVFKPTYRLGLTATPDRKDGCMQVATDFFGPVAVINAGEFSETHCYCLYSPYSAPPNLQHAQTANTRAILLKWLSRHSARNKLIVGTAADLYNRKRKAILVISDRVEHLQTLHAMLLDRGIPDAQIGYYSGFMLRGNTKVTIGEGYRRRVRSDETYRIVLATFAQMKEGVNIPRLDAGIDAMPQADGAQTIGRVRRLLPGKLVPVWFTIVDENIAILKAFAISRIKSYRKAGVTVHE
jgi:superfamily II DNA or RNA helicase